MVIEPNVAAGVINVPSTLFLSEGTRSSISRPLIGTWLTDRTPPLINTPGITEIEGVPVGAPHFNENKPLRAGASFTVGLADGTTAEIRSPVVNSTEGAMAVQQGLENSEWARMSGDSIGYVPHLRRAPLAGVPAKSVIVQFAKGDQSAVNPSTTAYLRAGELSDRATYYRHDLAYAENQQLPKNPHGFMTRITSTNPLDAQIAQESQRQIATFFASDGKETLHPEPKRFFEVPIQGPLPEELNYIP